MSGMDLAIVRTGTANLASVLAGFRRLGVEARLIDDPADVLSAARVVLPGVGAFAPAIEELTRRGLFEAIRERVGRGSPLLGICLGLQMLCAESEESPGVKGLGVIDGRVTRFPSGVRVPQLGWNRVEPQDGCRFLTPGYAYFANSYRLETAPEPWRAAITEHAGPFVSAAENGPHLVCQFHPELSGPWGLDVLKRWLYQEERGQSC